MENSRLKNKQSQVHNLDDTLRCTYCQKLLSTKQSLREHTYAHTGERPYKCLEPGCTKSFRQGSLLTIHRKVHLGIVKNISEHYVDCTALLFRNFSKIVEKDKDFNWYGDMDQITNIKKKMNKTEFEFITQYLEK